MVQAPGSFEMASLKKSHGIFFTPHPIVKYMVELTIEKVKLWNINSLSVLEPACGGAQFLKSISEDSFLKNLQVTFTGVEINKELFIDFFIEKNFEIIYTDFLLWETHKRFDIIIGNPPYGIPSMSAHYPIKIHNDIKSLYKKIFSTWYGKYNVYGAFIEKSINLLKENGILTFIVPASFLFLDEFARLRKFLSSEGRTVIIYMGEEVFKPAASVATVILLFQKGKSLAGHITLSEFTGFTKMPKTHLNSTTWTGEIVTFTSNLTKFLSAECPILLHDMFDIKISPRTTEIKNNPIIQQCQNAPTHYHIPLLNGKNLKVNQIIYSPLTGYWIHKNDLGRFRGYFPGPHIVVALGFRGDRQLASAFDKKNYPWMGDVYHLLKKPDRLFNATSLTEQELVDWLNSSVVRSFIIDTFKEVTYHLSITQLERIPVPPSKESLKKLLKISA